MSYCCCYPFLGRPDGCCYPFLGRPENKHHIKFRHPKKYGPHLTEDDLSVRTRTAIDNINAACQKRSASFLPVRQRNSRQPDGRWEMNLRVAATVAPSESLFSEQYNLLGKKLGKGMCGEPVVLAEPMPNSKTEQAYPQGTKVAVKTLDKTGLTGRKLENMMTEVDIYLRMDHPHVAKLMHVINERAKIFLVMEYCSGGALSEKLQQCGSFRDKDAALMIRQIMSAVNYCHNHPQGKVCHRDLKHSNFLFANQSEGAPLKLIDFGLSRILLGGATLTTYAGTLHYMAPEVVLQQEYGELCDMWSMGVIAYSLLCGSPPFYHSTDKLIARAIVKCELGTMNGKVWKSVSDNGKNFIRKLLLVDPRKRMNAKQALEHPWLTGSEEAHTCRQLTDVLTSIVDFAQQSAIRRAAAVVVVYSQDHGVDTEHLEELFRALDKDRTGTISAPELVQALHDTLKISQEEGRWIFGRLDINGHTEIHHSDFVAAANGKRLLEHHKKVEEAFSHFDVNKDGKIDLNELVDVLGQNFCGEDTEDIFRDLDTNGDRSIDLTEFVTKVTSPHNTEFSSQPRISQKVVFGRRSSSDVDTTDDIGELSATQRAQRFQRQGDGTEHYSWLLNIFGWIMIMLVFISFALVIYESQTVSTTAEIQWCKLCKMSNFTENCNASCAVHGSMHYV